MRRKICILTGSRADYSPLANVIRLLAENPNCELQRIETKGLLGNESHVHSELRRLRPDLFICLGDRIETLLAAGVAALLTIPIVHLHGGETTEGAVDDQFRHAISKLSYYHMVCHQRYADRLVRRLGESPERVFVVGAPSVDALLEEPVEVQEVNTLVCYHPETLGDDDKNLKLIADNITGHMAISTANEDIGGKEINDFWRKGFKPKSYSHAEWLTLMRNADVLIGNSSSFIFEGMTLGKKVVMIGDRQKGRYEDAVEFFKTDKYPYGVSGEVSPRIVELLMTLPIPHKPRKVMT